MIKSIIIVFVIVSVLMVGGRMYYVSGSTGAPNTGTSTFPETEYISTSDMSAQLATSMPVLSSGARSSLSDNTVIIDGTVLQAGF